MGSFPGSPRLVKGGLVLVDAGSGKVARIIVLQYNPDTLTRTLQAQAVSGDGGDRSEVLRLKGPAIETIKLDAEIDATDQLEFPSQNKTAAAVGIYPQLAALETVIYPTSASLEANARLADAGTLEIAPTEAPLTLFIWSQNRVVPVRVTDLSITEEAFDPQLNPIRAKVSLGLRVLSVSDFGFQHRGSGIFMAYLAQKERLSDLNQGGVLSAFGIAELP
jgi:hypothetical protein